MSTPTLDRLAAQLAQATGLSPAQVRLLLPHLLDLLDHETLRAARIEHVLQQRLG